MCSTRCPTSATPPIATFSLRVVTTARWRLIRPSRRSASTALTTTEKSCIGSEPGRARWASASWLAHLFYGRDLLDELHFDFDQHAGRDEAGHLHGRTGRKIRLFLGAEELRVGSHETFEVHAAALGRIADQVHSHRHDVAEVELHGIERFLDARECAQRLRLGVAPVGG